MNNRESKKDRVLVELEENPLVEQACRRANVPRSTFYGWCQQDRAFYHRSEMARERGRERMNDYAESKLLENIKNGMQSAIQYWLNNNSKTYSRTYKYNYMERYKNEQRAIYERNKEIIEQLDMDEAISMMGGDPEIVHYALYEAIKRNYYSVIATDEDIDV